MRTAAVTPYPPKIFRSELLTIKTQSRARTWGILNRDEGGEKEESNRYQPSTAEHVDDIKQGKEPAGTAEGAVQQTVITGSGRGSVPENASQTGVS